jgi:hypothetical protein
MYMIYWGCCVAPGCCLSRGVEEGGGVGCLSSWINIFFSQIFQKQMRWLVKETWVFLPPSCGPLASLLRVSSLPLAGLLPPSCGPLASFLRVSSLPLAGLLPPSCLPLASLLWASSLPLAGV